MSREDSLYKGVPKCERERDRGRGRRAEREVLYEAKFVKSLACRIDYGGSFAHCLSRFLSRERRVVGQNKILESVFSNELAFKFLRCRLGNIDSLS